MLLVTQKERCKIKQIGAATCPRRAFGFRPESRETASRQRSACLARRCAPGCRKARQVMSARELESGPLRPGDGAGPAMTSGYVGLEE